MSFPPATLDRMEQVADEVSELLAETGHPDRAYETFLAMLASRRAERARRVEEFAAAWEAAKKVSDDEIRAYYAKRRAEFTREEAEKYLAADEPVVPGDQLMAELEEIHRRYQQKGG